MTGQRQPSTTICAAFAAAVVLGGVAIPGAARAQGATTERVVVNRLTGLAIDGIDPVSYFTDGEPRPGDPAFEAMAAGAIWRFRNASNRAFFLAAPDIYAPRFGGYDPVDVARGVPVAGRPAYWLVSGERLYLFATPDHRDAFAANADTLLRSAAGRWPALRDTLAQ